MCTKTQGNKKSFVPVFLKVCFDHLFDNLESGKRNYCFGKKCENSPEFWIQKSVGTLMLVVKALMVGFEEKDYF